MVRTQIQLDEETYKEIKRLAYENGESMSAVVRELLARSLKKKTGKGEKKHKLKMSDFTFIGTMSGGPPYDVSERHDEILGDSEW